MKLHQTWPTVPRCVPVLLGAVLLLSGGVLIPVVLLRAAVVLPAALLAPGYAVVVTAFGVRPRLDGATTVALSAMLSMAVYPLLAIVLHLAGRPLTAPNVLLSMDLLLVIAAIAAARRSQSGAGTPFALPADAYTGSGSVWNGRRGGLLFGSLVALVATSLYVELRLLPVPVPAPYTQFYLAGPWAHLHGVLFTKPHDPLTVEVGFTNASASEQTYRVLPQFDTLPFGRTRRITLAPGHSWEGTVSTSMPAAGCLHRLSLALSMGERHTVLGALTLWVRSVPGGPSYCKSTPVSGPPTGSGQPGNGGHS